MIKKTMWIALALSLLGFVSVASVRADEWDKKTVITFNKPVEIPGQVLPAGTYTFTLADTMGDRHMVRIYNADGSKVLATVMAVSDYRITPTRETVILMFADAPAGSPQAIRAWFYPGNMVGQEFVYPKERATQLAQAAKTVVPAIAANVADVDGLKTAPIVAITPEAREVPVAAAIQTTPVERVASATAPTTPAVVAATPAVRQPVVAATPAVTQTAQNAESARQLPRTASTMPLVMLLGLGSIGLAVGLMMFGRRTDASR